MTSRAISGSLLFLSLASLLPAQEAPDKIAAQIHGETIYVREVEREMLRILGDRPVYLSFDIDGLDPAFAPGTGTPVWGGLSSIQAQIILRDIAGINIKGGDVVEVSPPYDTSGATAIAGAHVATQIICLLGWNLLMAEKK